MQHTIKNDHPIGIGSSSTGQGTTNGTRLDDLRIYDIELNSTQVTKIYNKGLLSKQIASAKTLFPNSTLNIHSQDKSQTNYDSSPVPVQHQSSNCKSSP